VLFQEYGYTQERSECVVSWTELRGENKKNRRMEERSNGQGLRSKSCGCLVIDQDFQGMNIMGLGPLRTPARARPQHDLHETGNERTSTILPILT
jgi:hypothetical protein